VLTGISGSLRDHPNEFIESRKELVAMFAESQCRSWSQPEVASTELHTTTDSTIFVDRIMASVLSNILTVVVLEGLPADQRASCRMQCKSFVQMICC